MTSAEGANAPRHSKVAVVGTGMVGSSFAYAAAIKGLCHHLALVNMPVDRAEGEAMDLNHGLTFLSPMDIVAGDFTLCRDAHVVVITAGVGRKPGESRLDLTRKNVSVIEQIVPEILAVNPDPVIVVVSNPVDILTAVTQSVSGLGPGRVFGSGTVLDSARFRYLLSNRCGIDSRSIHAHVIGEHGDSEVLVWSRINVAGVPLEEFCITCGRSCGMAERREMEEQVRTAGQEIIRRKGVTNLAIGLALTRIVGAVLNNERAMLTVSSPVQGVPGMEGVCLSLPSIVGFNGVERVVRGRLSAEEEAALTASAGVLRSSLKELGYEGC